jgi:hypothetical protein
LPFLLFLFREMPCAELALTAQGLLAFPLKLFIPLFLDIRGGRLIRSG